MTLSGGQKQRLFIALALINDPEVVFLDELTTGLDPQARRAIWDLVRGIRERGKTVFLTTHLMEEAERLCDRVAIIDHGRIVDIDTPAELVRPALPRADGRRRDRRTPTATSASARFRGVDVGDATTDGRSRFAAAATISSTDVIHCLSRASDPRHRLPHRAADARRRVPQADRPLDSRLRSRRCCADCWKLTWLEIKIFVREPLGVIGTVGSRCSCSSSSGGSLGRGRARRSPRAPALVAVDLPVLAAMLIALSAVLSLVTIIAIYREGGILKRLRATPLRPHTILTAHVLVKLLFTAITLALMVLAGRRYYPVGVDVPLVAFTLALLFSTLSASCRSAS